VAEAFRHEYPQNYYFHSDLDKFIEMNQNIKLWIHGHTHVKLDYKILNTRIVCNPLGYPNEQHVENYFPMVIDV
jgi:hypothetical protein